MNMFTAGLEILGEDGERWSKKTYGDEYVGMCMIGAIRAATNAEDIHAVESNPLLEIAASVIRERFPDRAEGWDGSSGVLITFNDYPETTFEDVRDVLFEAAVRLDTQCDAELVGS